MRGVELGGIGKSVAVAPSIGRGASAGFRIGGFPAPKMEIGIRNIANPFLSKGPVVEAKAPPQTIAVANRNLPSGPEAVEIAEQWLGILRSHTKTHFQRHPEFISGSHEIPKQVRNDSFELRPANFLWKQPTVLPLPNPEPVVKPKNEQKIQPKSGVIEFSKSAPANGALTELNKISVQENAVGQNVDEKPEVLEIEEVEESKEKDLLDEEVAEQRIYEISEAIDLAQTEANKEGEEEIDGPRILKFIRLSIRLISQIARKIRKDGSLDETLEELSSRKFSSKDQAKQQTKQLVFEKEPVKRGKEGKAVREGAVERVFKYHFVKRSPGVEVDKRVVKKQAIKKGIGTEAPVVALEPVTVKERRIEDLGLTEIFKKAA